MTQADLARHVGVSGSAVCQWLGDDGTNPSLENLASITEALGISLSKFWGPMPLKHAPRRHLTNLPGSVSARKRKKRAS